MSLVCRRWVVWEAWEWACKTKTIPIEPGLFFYCGYALITLQAFILLSDIMSVENKDGIEGLADIIKKEAEVEMSEDTEQGKQAIDTAQKLIEGLESDWKNTDTYTDPGTGLVSSRIFEKGDTSCTVQFDKEGKMTSVRMGELKPSSPKDRAKPRQAWTYDNAGTVIAHEQTLSNERGMVVENRLHERSESGDTFATTMYTWGDGADPTLDVVTKSVAQYSKEGDPVHVERVIQTHPYKAELSLNEKLTLKYDKGAVVQSKIVTQSNGGRDTTTEIEDRVARKKTIITSDGKKLEFPLT